MARTKKNAVDTRVEQAYYKNCDRVQIPIMKIGEVFSVGRTAIMENPAITDDELGAKILAFVNTIRLN